MKSRSSMSGESHSRNQVLIPVGLEKSQSIKLLYTFFSSSVIAGRWELARACVSQLHRDGYVINCDIKQILKEIISSPYGQSFDNSHIESPHHLSWLCLQEYGRLVKQEEDVDLAVLTQNVQFRLLLFEACSNISVSTLKELYQYHQYVIRLRFTKAKDNTQPSSLSSQLLQFLSETVINNPVLGNAVITSILSEPLHAQLKKNNEVLHCLYIKAIVYILDKLSSLENSGISSQTDGKISVIYNILALYNPAPYQNYVQIRELFSRLFELASLDPPVLDKTLVLSALVGRDTTYLVDEYCKLEYELLTKSSSNSPNDGLNEDQRCLLHISRKTSREDQLRQLFLMCVKKQQHLLEAIVDTSISLISNGMFDDLKVLLSPAEFRPLRPFLLLHGWSFCQTCSQARQLLQTLWDEQWQCLHPVLEGGCNKLAYQIDLIQWCLERTKPMLSQADAYSSNSQQRAADLFLGLENHSVLYVLHQSTRLASLEQKEVLDLLQKSPLQNNPDKENTRKNKSVRFAEDQEEACQDLHIERKRDISIFMGYCAIKNVMDSIYFCAEHSQEKLMNPIVRKHLFSAKVTKGHRSDDAERSAPASNKKSEYRNFQEDYTANVTRRLNSARDFLSKLQPLTYRVEIMEDIFSLVFLTHEDIQENSVSFESDSGEADDDDGQKTESGKTLTRHLSILSEESLSPQSSQRDDYMESGDFQTFAAESNSFDYDVPFIERPLKKSKSLDETVTNQKRELNSPLLTRVADQEVRSGNGSTISIESTSSYIRFGFLCNEYLVRDILLLLKDCLLDLSAARLKILGKGSERTMKDSKSASVDPKFEEALTKHVQASIASDILQSRITLLSQHVNEALWRFHLVCPEEIPKAAGEVLIRPVEVRLDEDEKEINSYMQSISDSKQQRKKISISMSSGSRSSPNVDSESTDAMGGDGGKRKRSRSQNHRRIRKSSVHMGIISNMLSSPSSLLNMCIQKGNYRFATEVIKLLKLEDRPEATEVKFAEVYSKCMKKVQSLYSARHGSVSRPSKPGKMSMKALASVAAAGVATVSVTEVAEELLSQTQQPTLSLPRSTTNIPVKFAQYFREDNLDAMMLFDLLVSSCKTWETCNNMIDVIKSKMSEISKDDMSSGKKKDQGDDSKKKLESKPKDIFCMIRQFELLLQMASDSNSVPQIANQKEVLAALYKHSIQTFLQTATLPLSDEECSAYANFVIELKRSLDKVDYTFQQHSRMPLEGYPSRPLQKISPRTSPHPSPKTEDDKSLDRPVLHNAVKQLIHVLQKHVPLGGVSSMISGCSNSSPVNRDYLQNLYEHLKGLAFVVAESEARSKESIVPPKNYFRMLDEGPIATLGKLMFALRISPAKFETVARKLSLNLTHIIVHSCCTRIPSKHLPVLPPCGSESTRRTKVLMNSHIRRVTDSPVNQNPTIVISNILTKLLHVMKDIAGKNNTKGRFDVACAKLVTKLPEYKKVISSVSLLQDVDLDQLQTKEEKLCFYGNLQNLMFIHMWMVQIESSILDRTEGHLTRHMSLKPTVMFSKMSMVEQLVHLSLFSYSVGQLGEISLFDLKYILNRSGLPAPTEFGGLLTSRILDIDENDPWRKYAPPPDPRILFVTASCSVSSPPVQVLVPELIRSQLQASMKKFLNQNVIVNKQQSMVTIPELVLWYKQDFCNDLEEYSTENEGIIHVIEGNTSGITHDALCDVLQLDSVHGYSENIDKRGRKELSFKVGFSAFQQEFLLTFEDLSDEKTVLTKGHRRVSSLPKNVNFTSTEASVVSEETGPVYQLTPHTLEYVKGEYPLVATLVSLVCADELDDIEEHLNVDYFTESLRSRSSSDMNVVDIRSYRYQKLSSDYPVLKRHILNYVIPIAGAEDEDILKSADPLLKFVTSNISEKVKACMLNLHDSEQFQTVLLKVVDKLLCQNKWTEAVSVLDCLPRMQLQQQPELCAMYDFILVCCVNSKLAACNGTYITKSDADFVTNFLRRFLSGETRFHTILSVYKHLPLDHAMELLDVCCFDDLVDMQKNVIKCVLEDLKLYYRVTACAKTLQVRMSARTLDFMAQEDNGSYYAALDKFMDWRNIMRIISPDEVLVVLLKAGDYDTAKLWCSHVKFPQKKKMEVIEHQLLSLLKETSPNTITVSKILEDLKKTDPKDCLDTCQMMMNKLTNQRDVLYVVSFMLNHLESLLAEDTHDLLCRVKIGAKILLCLPESLRTEYCHLSSEPRLLLEQLLMNMKVELAGKAYKKVNQDLAALKNQEHCFSQQDFNKLVAEYARKALDFYIIEYNEVTDKERSQSLASVASGDKLDSPADGSKSPTKRLSIAEPSKLRRSADMSGSRLSLASMAAGSSPGRGGGLLKSNRNSFPGKFVMPSEPPPKEKWQPDSDTDKCMVCKERFSMFNRRHHCRRCGRVVCATCSTKMSMVRGLQARTCDECHSQLSGLSKQETDLYQTHDNMSGASQTSHLPGLSSSVPPIPEEGQKFNLARAIYHSRVTWKLTVNDEDHNDMVRDEFYYEQAPSTSLCLSMLELHSNAQSCGQLMLDLCDDLSQYLKPIAPGVPNPEIDYSLVLNMMKRLLFHAKMKFISGGESPSLSGCEVYQSHIDLLGVLADDNYADLPSLQELTKKEFVMRLRDKLIQDERFTLAVEVSTKCGLDPSGVWAAWGMNCLQGGDFQRAREKYSRCLKVPVDRRQVQQMPKQLRDVIEYLESMPVTGSQLHILLSKPGSWKDLLVSPVAVTDDASLDSVQFQECIYYLKTYATFNVIIDFHRRNGRWMKAVQHVLDQKCTSEVFLESLLTPALKSGELGRLLDQMVMIDPSLEKWNTYLKATCIYLVKHKYHHVLYDLQIFMKDFVRAAMTCIHYFYLQGAVSYLDLHSRVNYLHNALLHIQSYLDPSQWGNIRRPDATQDWGGGQSSESSVRLILTPEEAAKHIKTISIQIEVTNFLYKCVTSAQSDVSMSFIGSQSSNQLPTMFGKGKAKSDLVNMVLLSGSDASSGFHLAHKIIKEYKLGAVGIFTHAAREMAKNRRYVSVKYLLDLVSESGFGDDDSIDEIVGACILVIADKPDEAKEAENLIKLLRKDTNKINAFILCGKLRSAYLMAVKTERVDDVQRIAGAAQRMGQTAVRNICKKWLEQRK